MFSESNAEWLRRLHKAADERRALDADTAARVLADTELREVWSGFRRISQDLRKALDEGAGEAAQSITGRAARGTGPAPGPGPGLGTGPVAGPGPGPGTGLPSGSRIPLRRILPIAAAALAIAVGALLTVRVAHVMTAHNRFRSEIASLVANVYSSDAGLGVIEVPASTDPSAPTGSDGSNRDAASAVGAVTGGEFGDGYVDEVMNGVAASLESSEVGDGGPGVPDREQIPGDQPARQASGGASGAP